MATSIYPFTPFVYLIGWSHLNKWYIGSRSSVTGNAHPSQLWTSYYTSSEHVEKFVDENGDPDVIVVCKTFTDPIASLDYEHKILRRLDAKNRDDFLNKTNGLPGEYRGDITGMKRIRNHLNPKQATEQKYHNPIYPVPEGWYLGGIGDIKWIRNHPNSKKATKEIYIDLDDPVPEGWYLGRIGKKWIRNHPDSKQATEQKLIIRTDPVPEGWYSGGMSRKWIINHIDPKQANKERNIIYNEKIPNGWYLGKLPCSEKTKKNMSKKNKGRKHSPETREKISKSNKGKKHTEEHKAKIKISSSKGSLITPHGVFITALDASKNSPYPIKNATIDGWCKSRNEVVINKFIISKSKYLQQAFKPEDIIGKTFKEIGFGFQPKNSSSD